MPPNCNPCPCMPLQKGAKIVAEVDGALKCLAIIVLIIILIQLDKPESLPSDHPIHQPFFKEAIERIRLGLIITLVITTMELLTCILLFFGAVKKNITLCWIWVGITVVSLLLLFLALILEFDMGTSLITSIIWISFRIYGVIVVIAFIKELRQQQQQQLQYGYLPAVFENQPQIEFQPENQDNSSRKPQPSVYAYNA